MKYACDLIRDLIPLYCDGACSPASAEAVEEHVGGCGECRKILEAMRRQDFPDVSLSDAAFEQRQIESIQKAKKKLRKRNAAFGGVGIVIGILAAVVLLRILMLAGVFGFLAWDMKTASIEVYEDADQYENYIGGNAVEPYRGKWDMDETIFPEAIADDMQAEAFRFVYYDPWDAQYAAYLTVEYTQEAYRAELARLQGKGVDHYTGYYSVSGEPEGYDILAMKADPYHGFVYALTPEEDSTSVTYVMILFCNYFLDLDIREYIPGEYLLQGFDADQDNSYRESMLGK